jgi:hypothetical protein
MELKLLFSTKAAEVSGENRESSRQLPAPSGASHGPILPSSSNFEPGDLQRVTDISSNVFSGTLK